jgi:uncharacterized membrane protein YphA (DoxX/SURF4 family)
MTDAAEIGANEINFYKNLGVAGGLLFAWVAGPGRYSMDKA